jgi:CheY-like chemotaxis protein
MAKILIVDDDADFQRAHRIVLESKGFEVAAAYSAQEGFEKVRDEEPDLVILDVMLPDGYEGFEVARQVREELGKRDLPILILTSIHARKQVPYRFAPDEQWVPVDVFLDKPVEPQMLVNKVAEMLGDRSGTEEDKVDYL